MSGTCTRIFTQLSGQCAQVLCSMLNGIAQFFRATHTFHTRKGRARLGTLNQQRVTERCCSIYTPPADERRSRCLFYPRTSITLRE